LQILGAVAELERQLIAARTRAGLKAAMARGARPGNPGVRERRPEAIAKITKARAARHLDQLLATVDDWRRSLGSRSVKITLTCRFKVEPSRESSLGLLPNAARRA
jgi:DNA invertase Pin-like site-specific DNA recombinase